MAPLASAKAGSFPRPFRVWNVRATPIAVEQPPWTAVCSAALAKLAQGRDHEKDTPRQEARQLRAFVACLGNLRERGTAWWGWEDSNQVCQARSRIERASDLI